MKLFIGGGKNETLHKDAFRDGGVKLIGCHVKIDVKTMGTFCFRPLCLLVEN